MISNNAFWLIGCGGLKLMLSCQKLGHCIPFGGVLTIHTLSGPSPCVQEQATHVDWSSTIMWVQVSGSVCPSVSISLILCLSDWLWLHICHGPCLSSMGIAVLSPFVHVFACLTHSLRWDCLARMRLWAQRLPTDATCTKTCTCNPGHQASDAAHASSAFSHFRVSAWARALAWTGVRAHTCVRACACVCVRACVCACMCALMRACTLAFAHACACARKHA